MDKLEKIKNTSLSTLRDFYVDGIYYDDAPKFCDARITEAHYADGEELTDDELDFINEDSGFVYETVIDWIY